MSRWLHRLAFAAWVGVGVATALLWAQSGTPTPVEAEVRYGDARSLGSSAPGGVLAFATLLEQLGYEVHAGTSAGAPKAEVLFLLGPRQSFTALEAQALLDWVAGGGRLVYGPMHLGVSLPAADAEHETVVFGDLLLERLLEDGTTPEASGVAALITHGRGLVAVLPEGGEVLSNASVQALGLAAELPWLRRVLGGRHEVAFDELRLGLAEGDGVVELLASSRFGPALIIASAALLLWLLGAALREVPSRREGELARAAPAEVQVLAVLLRGARRRVIASRALLEGTRQRLGGLAESDEVRRILGEVRWRPRSDADVVRTAAALRELEQGQRGSPECRAAGGASP